MIGSLRALDEELRERLLRVTTRRNEYGYDPFGADPLALRSLMLPLALVYRHWLRVETHGVERVPEGRVLLIGNHAGNTFAWDGAIAWWVNMAVFVTYTTVFLTLIRRLILREDFGTGPLPELAAHAAPGPAGSLEPAR